MDSRPTLDALPNEMFATIAHFANDKTFVSLTIDKQASQGHGHEEVRCCIFYQDRCPSVADKLSNACANLLPFHFRPSCPAHFPLYGHSC